MNSDSSISKREMNQEGTAENSSAEPSNEGSERPSIDSTQSETHVSFGEVNVHTHRMTLGTNPSANGIPVELAWYEEESETLTVDKFEKEHPIHEVHKIAKASREKIAQRRHTRQSIKRVENEVEKIKKSREKSEHDEEQTLGSKLKAPVAAFSNFWRK